MMTTIAIRMAALLLPFLVFGAGEARAMGKKRSLLIFEESLPKWEPVYFYDELPSNAKRWKKRPYSRKRPSILCPGIFQPETYSVAAKYIGTQIDRSRMRSDLDVITGQSPLRDGTLLEDRFSDGNKERFIAHIRQELEELGLKPYVEEFESGVRMERVKGASGAGVEEEGPFQAAKYRKGKNLVVEFRGKDVDSPFIEVSAHYDTTKKGMPGADDNGSGVITALEIARLLRRYPPERNVRVIFADFEELGFYGTQAHVRALRERGEKIVGAMVIDMIGYYPANAMVDRLPQLVVEVGHPSDFYSTSAKEAILANWSMAQSLLYHQMRSLDRDVRTKTMTRKAMPGTADHGAYWREDYPAVLIAAPFDPKVTNPNYHKKTDVPRTVNWDYLEATSRFAIEGAMFLSGAKIPALETEAFRAASEKFRIAEDTKPFLRFFSTE